MTTLASVSDRLAALFPLPTPLHQAAQYALFPQGKHLRPRLLIAVATLYKAPLSSLIDPACAIELIHTYSLIHDDLPCMDNDEMRRGRPSLHIAYPEWLALLTGNLLLTEAFALLSPFPSLSPLLAKASAELLEGQATDLLAPTTFEEWIAMARLKTGKLFSAACEMGALLGGSLQSAEWGEWGEHFGLLFQLTDDLHDGDAPFDQEDLRLYVKQLSQEVLTHLAHFEVDTSPIKTLIQNWLCRDSN